MSHMTAAPGPEALPLTNTVKDVELESDSPNCTYPAQRYILAPGHSPDEN